MVKAHEVDWAMDLEVAVQASQGPRPLVSRAGEQVAGLVSYSCCYQYAADSDRRHSGPVEVEVALVTSCLALPAP